MSSVRAIATIAVPAVAALLGLLWYFGRKKQPAPRKLVDPPDKGTKLTLTTKVSDQSAEVKESASISNGQAYKGSSNISESPVSSTNLGKPHFECTPAEKEDDQITSSSTAALNTESKLMGDGDAGKENVGSEVIVEAVIQESVVKPCLKEPCSSVGIEVETEKSVGNSPTSEPACDTDEPVLSMTRTENVFSVPEFSSPVMEQTAEKSQEINENISLDNGLLNSSNLATDSNVSLENKTFEHVSDKDSKVENLSNSEIESKIDSFTGSWHEDIPENDNMADLSENLSRDLQQNSTSENVEANLDDSFVPAQENDKTWNTENLESDNCSSKDLSPTIYSRTKKELEKLQSSPSSKTVLQNDKLPESNNHSDSSSNCDNLSEASNDSGKGGSVQENANASPPDEDRLFEFNIPSDLCGLFIGTRGKTIKMISQQSGTKIRLQHNPYTRDFQICIIEGSKTGIDTACSIIKRKFPSIKFPGMDINSTANPVIMPEIMQLSLPDGVSVDIVVSSIVDAGRIFVQQPTHPTYPSLDRLNTFMNQCYMQEGAVPDIPRPIESGVICAAPMLNGWYRAQIMASHDGCDECDIKYVDYGGYSRVSSLVLKQIRSDFMTLPFEAVECYLANITPLENEQYFSTEAAVVLEELTQGKLLQGQVVGRAEDGIPYVHVYQILGANSAVLVNREMVNRGVVRWVELME